MRMVRRFKQYLARCWAWSRFFWKEDIHEWDHSYLYQIFAFALERHANELERANRFVGVEDEVKHIRLAAILMRRMASESYGEEMLHEISEKYGWFKEGHTLWDSNPLREHKEQERKELKRLQTYEETMWQQDMDLFCKILRKHSRKWWD